MGGNPLSRPADIPLNTSSASPLHGHPHNLARNPGPAPRAPQMGQKNFSNLDLCFGNRSPRLASSLRSYRFWHQLFLNSRDMTLAGLVGAVCLIGLFFLLAGETTLPDASPPQKLTLAAREMGLTAAEEETLSTAIQKHLGTWEKPKVPPVSRTNRSCQWAHRWNAYPYSTFFSRGRRQVHYYSSWITAYTRGPQ